MAIFNDIDEFGKTVKINSSTPWDALSPYIDDARDKYLVPYLGIVIVEKLEGDLDPDNDAQYVKILPRVRRVLGPFAMAMGSAEMSINFGDSGHTVARTNTAAPASEAKIEKANNNLATRAWQNLEYLIKELEENINDFPSWPDSDYYKNRQTKFFDSAAGFQNSGLIDIEYKRLTFELLRNLIIGIEQTEVYKLLTADVFDIILIKIENNPDKEKIRLRLLECVRAYIGNRVAELHTSQTTREQRSKFKDLEYKGVIRPLYQDLTDTGNYYTAKSAFWINEIVSLLPDFGVDMSGGALNWNTEEKKLMADIG